MDGLTFTSNLVRDLAWPVTSIGVLAVLLKQLPTIGQFVKTIRLKDLELTLRDDFKVARETAIEVAAETPAPALEEVTTIPTAAQVAELADTDPRLAIYKIWMEVEDALKEATEANGLLRSANPARNANYLFERRKLTEADFALFQRLNSIRIQILYPATTASAVDVFEFRDLADILTVKLKQIARDSRAQSASQARD